MTRVKLKRRVCATFEAPSPGRRETYGQRFGHIVWWNIERGYGFLKADDSYVDIFALRSGIAEEDSLVTNEKVSFEVIRGLKGPQAVNIKRQIGGNNQHKD